MQRRCPCLYHLDHDHVNTDTDPDACRKFDDPDSEFYYFSLRSLSDRCTRPIDLDYPQDDQDIDQTDHRPYLRGRVPLETHILDFDHRLCPGPEPLWLGTLPTQTP